MNYNIKARSPFTRAAKKLGKRYRSFKEDYAKFLDQLEENPQLGTDLGNGLRKIRMAITSKGRGKSGGARVITFTVITALTETEVNLIYIYDKADRENITTAELLELLKRIGLR